MEYITFEWQNFWLAYLTSTTEYGQGWVRSVIGGAAVFPSLSSVSKVKSVWPIGILLAQALGSKDEIKRVELKSPQVLSLELVQPQVQDSGTTLGLTSMELVTIWRSLVGF
jgi:hypothetical protein